MSFFYGDEDLIRAGRRPLLIFVLATLALGAAASLFSEPAIPRWYAGLIHPSFAPPGWIFAPVWTALYVLMAVAAWRVWRVSGTRSIEMTLYTIQLALNFGWSWIFFGQHRIGTAFSEILILDLAIFITTILFFRRDRLAGLMFLPYLFAMLFAAFLTHALSVLNP
jgi:tryptophan-rich sensory protein